MKSTTPAYVRPYFWEVDAKKLDPQKHPEYIIARILEYGRPDAVHWMSNTFDRALIKKTIKNNCEISRKSAEFWRLYYALPRDLILCLRKSYQKKRSDLWPY